MRNESEHNWNPQGIGNGRNDIIGGDGSTEKLLKDALVTIQAAQVVRDINGKINPTEFKQAYDFISESGTSEPWIEKTAGGSEPQWVTDERTEKAKQTHNPAGSVIFPPNQPPATSEKPPVSTTTHSRS